ncbi:MAG TPA: hypothetical protein VE422_30720 [Terriglobia bacterium]|nr:hypothetical protein [Terriglobia bacterium]
MNVNSFLAALPAILAIGGFVIYQLIGHEKKGKEITAKIIGKLRNDSPENAAILEKLPPRQVAAKLHWDHDLQKSVSQQDIELLTRVSQQEFIKSLFVYGLIGLLFVVSVIAYVYIQSRPKPLSLSGWHLESRNEEAKGLAVDLDDLVVSWTADGPSEDLVVQLENIQTGRRTGEFKATSSEQRLTFPFGTYRDLLSNRRNGSVNRVRVIARSLTRVFMSEPVEVRVGITILAVPVEEDSALWMSALIDNGAIQGYRFDARLVVWSRKASESPASFGGEVKNPKAVFPVSNFSQLDWRSAKIAYFGPDDPRLVRTQILYPTPEAETSASKPRDKTDTRERANQVAPSEDVLAHASTSTAEPLTLTGSYAGPRGFDRGMASTVYCGNQPESWVRGSASLDTKSGTLSITIQLETDSTVAGPRGRINVTLRDARNNVLGTALSVEIGTGGKPLGPAAVRNFTGTTSIPLEITTRVRSLQVEAQCTGSTERLFNVDLGSPHDSLKIQLLRPNP